MQHLSQEQQVYIVDAFENLLIPAAQLAERYGITRQGIYKVLRRHGVDTTKRKLEVSCSYCEKVIHRHKSQVRKRKRLFCNDACYFAFLAVGNGQPYVQSRHGQRIGRVIVGKHYSLQPGNIVHHEDRDTRNNSLENLRVFRNQGDHVRYHRLGPEYAFPVWSGADL
jgi:hypothetical protein